MRRISRLPAAAKFAAGILLVLGISLGIFSLLMNPPAAELGLMTGFLLVTALLSSLVGFAAYRLGWMNYSPSLRWTLLGGYALASLLTFFNVWLTARLMFTSDHDLLLSVVLLIFAGGIAMVLGYFYSSALVLRISRASKKLPTGWQGAI